MSPEFFQHTLILLLGGEIGVTFLQPQLEKKAIPDLCLQLFFLLLVTESLEIVSFLGGIPCIVCMCMCVCACAHGRVKGFQ